ncbi:MAG: helix-turn-helix domain-containing protein [Alphaproteobacteria bacterium]
MPNRVQTTRHEPPRKIGPPFGDINYVNGRAARTRDRCRRCEVSANCVLASGDFQAFERFLPKMDQILLERDQVLYLEGDPARHVHAISEGALKLYKTLRDGRNQVVGFAFPGDFVDFPFGELHDVNAEAVIATRVCRLPRSELHQLCERSPRLEEKFREIAVHEITFAHGQMLLLGRKTASERIASFLLMMSGVSRRLGNGADGIFIPMARVDIADYLGLTVETVSRTLSRMKSDRLIDIPDIHHVTLCDIEAINDLAEGED